MVQDHRIYPRANAVLPVTVSFRDPQMKVATELEGQTQDISNGGIGLLLRKRIPTTLPTATLQVRTSPNYPPVNLDVRVIWLEPTATNGSCRCGFQFMNVSDEQLQTLRGVLWPKDEFIEQSIQHLLEMAQEQPYLNLVTDFFKKDVKEFLLEIIKECGAIQNSEVSEEEGQRRIDQSFDNIADRGDEVERTLNHKLLALEIKKAFRLLTGSWVYQSRIIKLAYEKPRGYPGDYEMLELIYNNEPITSGAGRYLDKYFLKNAYAEAVRRRKAKMKELLRHHFQANQVPVRVLNIACGSCREVREIVREIPLSVKRLALTALDQDREALDFSEGELKSIAPSLKFQCVQADVLNLIKNPEQALRKFGRQCLIYSIGLADYLPDRVLTKFIRLCFDLLEPRGECIVAHKDRDADHHAPLLPDWFCDWKFYPRNESRLRDLISDVVPEGSMAVDRDDSGKIMFCKVSRT